MLALNGLNPVSGKEPLSIPRPLPVITQTDSSLDEETHDTGTKGDLQVQQDIEAPACERATQINERPEAAALVSTDNI